jgi:probable rRNA maturation factor
LARAGEVRAAVVSDGEMAAAHEKFCGIPGTTDVLTFDESPEASGVLDVDILVCLDEARRQGQALGHPPERELLLYIVHGVLHCLGYDDHDEASAEAMHRREDELLEQAGIGATFAPRGSAA